MRIPKFVMFTGAAAVAVTASAAAGDTAIRILDDSLVVKATLERFDYIGHWQTVSGKHDGRTMGTSTRSTHAGDVAILHFRGTRIRLYGVCGPSGGRAGVALDGASTGKTIDFYAPHVIAHALVYESPELSDDVHTLAVAVWGMRDEKARYYYVNIDDAEIELPPTKAAIR